MPDNKEQLFSIIVRTAKLGNQAKKHAKTAAGKAKEYLDKKKAGKKDETSPEDDEDLIDTEAGEFYEQNQYALEIVTDIAASPTVKKADWKDKVKGVAWLAFANAPVTKQAAKLWYRATEGDAEACRRSYYFRPHSFMKKFGQAAIKKLYTGIHSGMKKAGRLV